jgi:predicted ATP-binding protein involved in virulence
MYQDIAQLHDKVLEFLLEKRKEDPELYFTLRKEPRGLAKGHWFFGNEKNLYFSFWKGIDWEKNLPNISITITIEEHITVFLNNSEGGKKDLLFEEITQNIEGFRKLSNNYQWKKTVDAFSWQEALIDFIDNDKAIIDALLSKYNNYVDKLTLITKEEFNNSLKANKIIRESSVPTNQPIITQNFGKTLQLTHLKLVNIKHFEQIEIDLTKSVTILIGENGSGKSTLLSAIALGLTGHDVFSQNINNPYFDSKKNAYLKIESVKKGEHRYAKNGSIHLSYKIERENYTNEVGFEKTIENELYPQPYSSVKASLSKILLDSQEYRTALNTFVIGFPQGKGYKKETMEFQKVQYPEPFELLPLITNTVNENYIDELATWLGEQCDKYHKNKSEQNNNIAEANKQAINLVFSIISLIVSNGDNHDTVVFDWGNFIRKDNKPIVFIRKPDTPQGIDLDLISAGYRNLFYWIGGIVSRLYKLNDFYSTNQQFKHLYKEDIRQHSGIVLIDEIDTYLHPKWQRNILKVLVEEFPKLQFVVTTHSPLVIRALDKEKIDWSLHIIANDMPISEQERKNNYQPYSALLNEENEILFDIPQREPEIKVAFNDIFLKITKLNKISLQKELEENQIAKAIESLKARLNPNDQDIIRAEIALRTKKINLQNADN